MQQFRNIGCIILSLTTALFLGLGADFPRPIWFFVAVAASAGIYTIGVIEIGLKPKIDLIFLYCSGLIIRISGFIHVQYSGSDHWILFSGIVNIIESGVRTGGMYEYAPFYHYTVGILKLVIGVQISTVRFGVLFISASLPVLITSLIFRATKSGETGFFGGILTVFYPLGFRTSTLLEPEAIALVFAVVVLFAIEYRYQMNDLRMSLIMISVGSVSVFVHFLYGLIIFSLVTGTTALRLFWPDKKSRKQLVRIEIPTVIIVGILMTYHILSSGYGGVAVGYFLSLTDISVGSGSGSLLSAFIPSSGGSTSGGGQSSLSLLGMVLPYLILGVLAVSGGIYASVTKKHRRMVSAALTIIALTIVAAFGFGAGGIQVRFYYFVGILMLVFAGMTLGVIDKQIPQTNVVKVLMLICIVVFAVTAPLSGLSNNLDPRFGGTVLTTTEADINKASTIDRITVGSVQVSLDADMARWMFKNSYKKDGGRLVLADEPRYNVTQSDCSPVVWTDGEVHLCKLEI